MSDLEDITYLDMCADLALKYKGKTSPNPRVGCIIVKNKKIIGEGYHRGKGTIHAEVDAINNSTHSLNDATLYCNLEPCSDNYKSKINPPCVDKIIQSKIKKVVISSFDPNPHVSGMGIEKLKYAGIETKVIESDKAKILNEDYFKYIKDNKSFVHIKIASSLDGCIATNEYDSKWITDKHARIQVHSLRAKYDAIMIGYNTLIKDNPTLNTRLVEGESPIRVILDSDLKSNLKLNVYNDYLKDKTYIATSCKRHTDKWKKFSDHGINLISIKKNEANQLQLKELLTKLYEMNVMGVLVEGGANLVSSFIKENLFDKISIFYAPIFIGNGIKFTNNLSISQVSQAIKLQYVRNEMIKNQILVEGYS